ncbi:hypothetical protein [Streptomyces sp. NPDC050485]|uniref:hypothetical protein n=1 Tax=Streptomyces sp. NPDC050485 TaxID=3365617 RepID=UPI00378B8624
MTGTERLSYLLDISLPAGDLAHVEGWVNPGPPRHNRLDGYSAAQLLLLAAIHEAQGPLAVSADLENAVARHVLSCGSQALRGNGSKTLRAYIGTPLFAGRVAAETIRAAVQRHPEARLDGELNRLLDNAVESLWTDTKEGWIHPHPRRDAAAGLGLIRHVNLLQYSRDVHRGLDWLGRTAACNSSVYQPHLRKLCQMVFEEHLRSGLNQGRTSLLGQALTAFTPMSHTTGGDDQ